MPLLHLDARPDLVQCIKLCEHIIGRGTWRTRPPRLPLEGPEKAAIEALMKHALATRPVLPEVGSRRSPEGQVAGESNADSGANIPASARVRNSGR